MTVTDRQPVADIQQVRLHALHLRDEGEEWIVGRVDTGRFVALPPVGVRAIELLREGISIAAATEKLSAEQGKPVEVASFVAALVRLGFVAEVDGVTVAGAKPTKSTFAWIKPSHVRWALHPAIWVGVALTMLAAIGVYVFHHGETIRSSDLLWSNRGSLVIVSLVALAWSTIFLHEIAHLITARAAGVPGRMSLGTRLQFLAAQTDVSGIWSAPRRTRMVVYLSGMAVNTVLASAGVLLASLCPPGAGRTFGAVLCISQLMLLSGQFMFFMRTDIYFVVQDLARCRDLYGDTTAYVRYLMRKVTGRSATGDPSLALPGQGATRCTAVLDILCSGNSHNAAGLRHGHPACTGGVDRRSRPASRCGRLGCVRGRRADCPLDHRPIREPVGPGVVATARTPGEDLAAEDQMTSASPLRGEGPGSVDSR